MKKFLIIGVFVFASLSGASRVFALSCTATSVHWIDSIQVDVTGCSPFIWDSMSDTQTFYVTGSSNGNDGAYSYDQADSGGITVVTYDTYPNTGITESGVTFSDSSSTPPTPPPVPLGGSTSTVEQSEQNLANATYIFFISVFLMIWLMRKH